MCPRHTCVPVLNGVRGMRQKLKTLLNIPEGPGTIKWLAEKFFGFWVFFFFSLRGTVQDQNSLK